MKHHAPEQAANSKRTGKPEEERAVDLRHPATRSFDPYFQIPKSKSGAQAKLFRPYFPDPRQN